MFAHDRGWNRVAGGRGAHGLTAEAAVERVRSEHRARLGQARDPYLRERLHDLEDLRRPPAAPPGRATATRGRELPDERHPDRPQPGPRRPAGIRPHQAGGPAAGGGLARPATRPSWPGRWTSPAWAAWSACADRVSEGDPVIVDAETGEALPAPAARTWSKALQARLEVRRSGAPSSPAARHARLHPGRGQDHPADERAAWRSTSTSWARPGRRASACSAPSSSSWWPRRCRG